MIIKVWGKSIFVSVPAQVEYIVVRHFAFCCDGTFEIQPCHTGPPFWSVSSHPLPRTLVIASYNALYKQTTLDLPRPRFLAQAHARPSTNLSAIRPLRNRLKAHRKRVRHCPVVYNSGRPLDVIENYTLRIIGRASHSAPLCVPRAG